MKPFTPEHPYFVVEGWPEPKVSAQDMVRHFLITGETGSGKSVSGVMPLLKAVLRYPTPEAWAEYSGPESQEELRPAAFVIDPKNELRSLFESERGEIKSHGPVHLFEGMSLGPQEAMDMILQQSDLS